MTTDDFLDRLRPQWRTPDPDAKAIAQGFARYRRWRRLKLAASVLGIAVVAASFAGMAWLAILGRDAASIVAAVALGAALVPLGLEFATIRGRLAARYDETPLGMLRLARDRNAVLGRGVRIAWSAVVILLMATLALWCLPPLGIAQWQDLVLPSAAWLATTGALALWLRRRGRALVAEAAGLAAATASLTGAGDEPPSPWIP